MTRRSSNRWANLYLSCNGLLERLLLFPRALVGGLWLGVLNRDALHAVDEVYYDGEAIYTDQRYNEFGLWDWERVALEEFFVGRRRLVVTAAGGGREVLALLRLGYEVSAFECNETLVQAANKLLGGHGFSERVQLARRDCWPEEAGECDGVIVGWGSYMLIPERDHRIKFLRQVRAHLPEGSPLLLSFFARPGDSTYFRLLAGMGNAVRRVAGRERLEVGDVLAPNFLHVFTREQLVGELREAGFETVSYGTDGYGRAVGIANAPVGNQDAASASPELARPAMGNFLALPSLRATWWTAWALRRTRRTLRRSGLAATVDPPPTLPPGAIRGVYALLDRQPNSCLERALVLQRWFASQGEQRQVVVGVAYDDDEFSAHAWLDFEATDAHNARFHELTRLPSP